MSQLTLFRPEPKTVPVETPTRDYRTLTIHERINAKAAAALSHVRHARRMFHHPGANFVLRGLDAATSWDCITWRVLRNLRAYGRQPYPGYRREMKLIYCKPVPKMKPMPMSPAPVREKVKKGGGK